MRRPRGGWKSSVSGNVPRVADIGNNLTLFYGFTRRNKHFAAMCIARVNTVAVVDIDVVAPAVMIFCRIDNAVCRRAEFFAVCIAGRAAGDYINAFVIRVAIPTIIYICVEYCNGKIIPLEETG